MEQETFWTLLHNAPHWEFELFLMFIFDVVIGLIIWPYLRRFCHYHPCDNQKIDDLSTKVAAMQARLNEKPEVRLLTRILDDGTSDQGDPRVWPIRAKLYREIAHTIGYEYDANRAMNDSKYPRK